MLFGGTQAFLEAAVVALTLLFFLLASGDLFLRRVIALVAGPQERSRAGEIALEIEKQLHSLPGGLAAAVLIGLAALLTFDDTGRVVTIVLVFLALATLKGYILVPLVMGRQLTLNALMLFVALTFWWWAWGIPGALLAVPLMAILKIFSDRMVRNEAARLLARL